MSIKIGCADRAGFGRGRTVFFSGISLFFTLLCVPFAHADKVALRAGEGVSAPDLLKELRSKLPEEATPETAFEAKRQTKRAVQVLTQSLNAIGYYDPDIQPAVGTNEGFSPEIIIDPGLRFTLGELSVDYVGTQPRAEDAARGRGAIEIRSGDVAIPLDVIRQETEIISALKAVGYPYAASETRKVIGDRDAATLDVTYVISSGPRVRFGDVVFPDAVRTDQNYLRKLIPFDDKEIATPKELNVFGARLDETRLFNIANARLADSPSSIAEDGAEIRDVIVTLKERKRHTVEAGLSLSTDKGIGLFSELTRRNFSNRGDFLIGTLELNSVEQSLGVKWQRPNRFGYGRGLVFGSEISNEDTDAYNRQSFTLSGGYEVRKDSRFTYGAGVQGSLIREKDDFGERDLQLLSFYGDASIDRADSVLNATKGWRADARLEPSIAFGGDSSQFVRAVTQLRGYYPVNQDRSLVLAGRVRVGTVWGAELATLPSTSRFFAGGGGSVRGYAYEGIGPRSDDNDPTGGRSLLETAIEARWRVRDKISLVGFVDAGSVTTKEVPAIGDLRAGAGFGVRYDTLAGPLRIDIAAPLDKTINDDPFHVYISLGQAF